MTQTSSVNPSEGHLPASSKEIFASAYLTLASIIQGVALAALVQRVESTYVSFDAVAWVMTAGTFIAIIVIWHEYLMMVLGFVWVPTLVDSVVPFAFVVGELFMTHFVSHELRNWLLAYGATFAVGIAAWLVTGIQLRTHVEENRQVMSVVGRLQRRRGMLVVALTILALAAWADYDLLGLGQVQLGVAIAAVVFIVVYAGSSIPYWSLIGRHARRPRAPTA